MPKAVMSVALQHRHPDSHKELALAVLVQAIRDLDAPSGVREDAEAFFETPAVAHWCGVAGLDPEFVRGLARKFRELQRPSRRRVRRPVH